MDLPVTPESQVHVTTSETLTSDLKASLLKMDFEDRDICHHAAAERLARMCLSLQEPDTLNAAIWRAAEYLMRLRYPHLEGQRLIGCPDRVRAECVTHAAQAFFLARAVLEGVFPRRDVEQAAADYYSHMEQLAARRVVPFGKVQ